MISSHFIQRLCLLGLLSISQAYSLHIRGFQSLSIAGPNDDLADDDVTDDDDDGGSSNTNELYFVVIIAAILCCGCTCLSSNQCSPSTHSIRSRLTEPLLAREEERRNIFGNSLIEEENEWLCPVCAFENRPRAGDCSLCGTSRKFASNYYDHMRTQPILDTDASDGFRVTMIAPKASFTGKKKGERLAEAGEGLGANWRPKATQTDRLEDFRHSDISRTSIGSASPQEDGRSSMSALTYEERQQAFMVRRFNALTIRQKAAHRRRLWKRKLNQQTGCLEWTRVAVPFVPGQSVLKEHEDRWVDSFGDQAVMAHSPGYTTVLDASSPGAVDWQQVDDVAVQPIDPIKERLLRPTSNDRESDDVGVSDTYTDEDLESVAAYPFRRKQQWFQCVLDRVRTHDIQADPSHRPVVKAVVNRNFILETSVQSFNRINPALLSRRLRIEFEGEPGIDAGGLLREWFLLVSQKLFDPDLGLFVAQGEELAYTINPVSDLCNSNHLELFLFAGRFLGKALLEHQTLNVHLSLPLLKHILAIPISFSDLEFVDGEMYQNLLYIRNNEGAEALSLDYTVTFEHNGHRRTHNLIANGADVEVTDENKDDYLLQLFRYRMLESVAPQLWYLLKGLYEVIPRDALSVFDYQELELLLSGVPHIDLDDWKRHTRYVGLYKALKERHPVVEWFWDVLETFSHEERARLLQFCTGSSRLPAQGFKALEAHDGNFRLFTLAGVEKREYLYPRAHTCFNRIDLPCYDSKEELEGYLSLVINMEITGFQID